MKFPFPFPFDCDGLSVMLLYIRTQIDYSEYKDGAKEVKEITTKEMWDAISDYTRYSTPSAYLPEDEMVRPSLA
jgi:hypothetical protein